MARARFIRPEFFTDSKTGRMPLHVRLLYIACWPQADIQGVLEWDADQLRLAAFPYDPYTTSDVAEMMRQIVDLGRVRLFTSAGKQYAVICRWAEHQRFTSGEKKNGARFPAPVSDHGQTNVRPMSDHGQTFALSLPLSPALSPAPAPAVQFDQDTATATAAAKKLLSAQIFVGHDSDIIEAVNNSDHIALLRAFGCNMTRPAEEWERDADGMPIGILAALLCRQKAKRDPIREPSGLRKARQDWKAITQQERQEWADEIVRLVSGVPA